MSAQSAIFNPSQTTSAASGDGFSVPRLTTTGRLAISFTTQDQGMMVYDTTLNNLFIWNGSAWESVPASGDAGANGSVQYNDNGVVSGAANLQYDKAGGFTSLRSGSALRAYVADNSVYSTINDNGAAGGLTINNLNADGISLRIGSVNAYTLSSGVATWYDGAGGTRMTLDSTGLGLGGIASGLERFVVYSGGSKMMSIDTNGTFFADGGTGKGRLTIENSSSTNSILSTTTLFGSYNILKSAASQHQWFIGGSTQAMTLDASGNLILQSSATPATLTTNGQLTVNATSNTNLRFSYRGSDGTTRVANITLA